MVPFFAALSLSVKMDSRRPPLSPPRPPLPKIIHLKKKQKNIKI